MVASAFPQLFFWSGKEVQTTEYLVYLTLHVHDEVPAESIYRRNCVVGHPGRYFYSGRLG